MLYVYLRSCVLPGTVLLSRLGRVGGTRGTGIVDDTEVDDTGVLRVDDTGKIGGTGTVDDARTAGLFSIPV